ncbi:MAG: lysine-sensitive aspartokinase 3 [Bacteroidota bacterium]
MIVMKFGGTSVEDAAAMRQVKEIVRSQLRRSPVVVLSAIALATNRLLECAQLAAGGKLEKAKELAIGLRDRHHEIIGDLCSSDSAATYLRSMVNDTIGELITLSKGLTILGELSPRSLDAFGSAGERMSSAIFNTYLNEIGIASELVDARSFMITNEHFTKAAPLFDAIERLIPEKISPHISKGKIVVTQGFIGATMSGVTTTLGRGGSDYSAAIIGAALGVDEIQIWTDVDGVMTSDPRIVPTAMKLDILSFQEASELAYFGAKVLHPSTIIPAIDKKIPVIVLNSKRPSSTGTRIVPEPSKNNLAVKAIACKKGITVINILSTRMLMAYGFMESIFSVFNRFKTSVDLVSTSEVCVSMTIDNDQFLDEILKELKNFADVTVFRHKAIICIIGEQMRATAGITNRIFNALHDVEILMISQGASEINMSVVIEEQLVEEAVRQLHNEFFPQ